MIEGAAHNWAISELCLYLDPDGCPQVGIVDDDVDDRGGMLGWFVWSPWAEADIQWMELQEWEMRPIPRGLEISFSQESPQP